MNAIVKIKNYLKYICFRKDEAIKICLKHQIPLTDININEVRNILKQQKNADNKAIKINKI